MAAPSVGERNSTHSVDFQPSGAATAADMELVKGMREAARLAASPDINLLRDRDRAKKLENPAGSQSSSEIDQRLARLKQQMDVEAKRLDALYPGIMKEDGDKLSLERMAELRKGSKVEASDDLQTRFTRQQELMVLTQQLQGELDKKISNTRALYPLSSDRVARSDDAKLVSQRLDPNGREMRWLKAMWERHDLAEKSLERYVKQYEETNDRVRGLQNIRRQLIKLDPTVEGGGNFSKVNWSQEGLDNASPKVRQALITLRDECKAHGIDWEAEGWNSTDEFTQLKKIVEDETDAAQQLNQSMTIKVRHMAEMQMFFLQLISTIMTMLFMTQKALLENMRRGV